MRRVSTWVCFALLVSFAVMVSAASAGRVAAKSKPKIVGNAKIGKSLFSNTCGLCHRLKAAKSSGTAGPDLNRVKLTEPVIIKAITSGGATVMTKAQVARYTTTMTAYRNALTTAQIQDIAAFVYNSTHPK
jgi:mono/diheme cytochrome c family protein